MWTEKLFPISWNSWDYIDESKDLIFKKVTFMEDFGPWKAQEPCAIIKLLLSEARIEEWGPGNNCLKECNIALVVRESAPAEASEEPEPIAA